MGNQKKSRIVPAKLHKGGVRQNKHRYQGFHERVASLTINPVQRARQQDERTTESYVKAKLDFWKDTNLSTNFKSFVQEADPLCDSLAQILHNEQRIFDLLIAYIAKRDENSLEPLLDLLNQFAHDIGPRFEQYYAASLNTIAALVSGHQIIEVIEWSFNTLAWLFHYLSKLLVPDLRPTYDVLAPLLGKEVRKEHVARFAAEALSFLIRKAGGRYQRDPEPLRLIVKHALQDWVASKLRISGEDVFGYGLMTMFTDAIKSTKASQSIHTSGLPILQTVLEESLALGDVNAVAGITTSLIHHTNADTFSTSLAIILEQIQSLSADAPAGTLIQACIMLYTIIAVRKGDRISNWSAVFQTFNDLYGRLTTIVTTPDAICSTLPTLLAASLLQTAPFDILIPQLQSSMDMILNHPLLFDFPAFCLYAHETNTERFHELLKPYMFRYMASNWSDDNVRLLFSIERLIVHDSRIINGRSSSSGIHFKNWPERIASTFENWKAKETSVVRAAASLEVAHLLTPESSLHRRITQSLCKLVASGLKSGALFSDEERRFFAGPCLSWCLRYMSRQNKIDGISTEQILTSQHQNHLMTLYVENLAVSLDHDQRPSSTGESMYDLYIQNLSTESSALRLASLRLLAKLLKFNHNDTAPVLDSAMAIEAITPDHQSMRTIAMYISQLASGYSAVSANPWLAKAVVHYLFGILTIRLAPVWKDATSALKLIYDAGKGDGVQLIEDLTFLWLDSRPSVRSEETPNSTKMQESGPINEFQCTNERRWRQTFEAIECDGDRAEERLHDRFVQIHGLVSPVPDQSVTQALTVLAAIPSLAERRSRRLVPLFLKWASMDGDSEATLVGDSSSDSDDEMSRSGLSRRDQKAMLDVFGLFQNPSVLHQSGEVYNALLRLLCNGDLQIQKAALKALSTWKQPAVKKYQEELNNLLDNARFREELVIFLPNQTEDSGVPTIQRRELMNVLLRLLYGRVIARGSAAAGRTSQTARRRAVFETLGSYPQEDLTTFVEIVIGPLKCLKLDGDRVVSEDPNTTTQFPLRKQMGLVRLFKDLLDSLGDKLEHLTDSIVKAILFCLDNVNTVSYVFDEDDEADENTTSLSSMQKAVRQDSLKCLAKVFQTFKSFDTVQYGSVINTVVIKHRVGARFAAENAQSISSMLKLLSIWSAKSEYKQLLFEHSELLPSILACLKTGSNSVGTKTEVQIYVLDQILKPLITDLKEPIGILLLERGFYESLVQKAAALLQHGGSKELLASSVSVILQVASSSFTERPDASLRWSSDLASQLVDAFAHLLDLPNQVIRAPTKTSALTVLSEFLPFLLSSDHPDLLSKLYQTLSKMFSSSKDPIMRQQLSRTFDVIAKVLGDDYIAVARLCSQLNAVSMGRLKEPDFDERERACETIARCPGFTDDQWLPLIHNGLFSIKDTEELVVRKGASMILRRFVETNSAMHESGDVIYPVSKLLRGLLLPALRRGASERAEVVRLEYLSVMSFVVRTCPQWPEIRDLAALAATTEDSESFFDGILHIQQDWRIRSLIKLARLSRQGVLSSNNIAHYLLPLVEQFVFDRADEDNAHPLAAQAITTIGAMMSALDWTQARKTLRRYSGTIKDKPELEKAVIRLIGVCTEALHNAAQAETGTSILKDTIPAVSELVPDVENALLPPLAAFLHHKDETVVSLRVPIAVSAARLICLLPDTLLEYKLAPVLTDVCNILRSKAQDSRDLSRKTLSEIAALVGPGKFGFIIKELRIALSRGTQLHVLSFTVHSLLVQAEFGLGDLDYCINDLMRVVLDDTFGATGQEKDAEGYTNKAKEVKGNKSMDTVERVAKIASVECYRELILPLQRFLTEKLTAKDTTKIDELLRRIRTGLEQNEAAKTQPCLVFCYEVLKQSKNSASHARRNAKTLTRKELQQKETFEIKTKGARKAPLIPQVSSQQYKLARFALDLLREVLRRHEDLRTAENITGFLVPVGDVLIEAQEEVQISALRFLASVIKTPMREWTINAPVYADTAFKALLNQPDTNTELSQASLKLLTAIIRDRPDVALKDSQLARLIKMVVPDLTQPASQGVTFNFLKAIVQRHIVLNEVYESMDALAKLFITYGDGSARNQARSIWLTFVTSYEQSEKRFEHQLGFLEKNLGYKHSEGRQSVMEAIHFLLGKLDHDHLQQALRRLFPHVMAIFVGDDNPGCREMAGLLLKAVISKSDTETLGTVRKALQNYIIREDKHALQTAALRVYALYTDADPERAKKDLGFILERLQVILADSVDGDNTDWELPYHALQLCSSLCSTYDEDLSSVKMQSLWTTVYRYSSYPHAWVKYAAARLLRVIFATLDGAPISASGALTTNSGLKISHSELCDLIRNYFYTMLRYDVQDWLVSEVTENIATLEKTIGGLKMSERSEVDATDEVAQDAGQDEDDDTETTAARTIRDYALGRISAIVRRDSRLVAKHSALNLLSSIVGRMPGASLEPILLEILRPLSHATDINVSRTIQADEQATKLQDELADKSNEIMTILQRKLPEGAFVSNMHQVQQEAKERREERRNKRRIEAVADPERYAKDKSKKRFQGRERRKERNEIHRSKRRGY